MTSLGNAYQSHDIFGYDGRLPESIRQVFMLLCQDVLQIQIKWRYYLELYSSADNTALLSELAQRFFQVIEESLRHDLTMAICRLSDPPQSMGKDNLSLQALSQSCGKIDNVAHLVKDFIDACEPIRKYRNKSVGHNDLATVIKPHDNPLPGIGRGQIDAVLRPATKTLDVIFQHFTQEHLFFGPIPDPLGAEDLIYWLKVAKECKEKRLSSP